MVAVLDAPALTGFHRGLFGVSAEDDCVYLIADAGAIPLPRTRVLTTLDDAELSPIGADWGPMLMAPASPVAVGNTQFEGRLGGLYHGETGKFFIDGAHGLIAGPVVFDMMREVLDSRITFTGDNKRTYFDSSGVMQTAATNAPRWNYRYSGGLWVKSGLLVEPPATNSISGVPNYNPTTTTGLTKSGDAAATLTVVDDPAELAAAGLGTVCSNGKVFKLDNSAGSTNAYAAVTTAITFGASTWALSTYARGSGTMRIEVNAGTWTGTVTQALSSTYSRKSSIGTTNTSNNQYRLGAAAGSVLYFILMQAEVSPVETSVVRVSGSTATRAADVASITGTNFSNLFNQSEGMLVVEADSAAPAATVVYYALTAQNATATERLYMFHYNGQWGSSILDDSVAQCDLKQPTYSPKVAARMAFAYKANDFAVSVNGAAASTDTSGTVATPDRLYLGCVSGTSGFINGHIHQLRYLPWRPSNTVIPALAA